MGASFEAKQQDVGSSSKRGLVGSTHDLASLLAATSLEAPPPAHASLEAAHRTPLLPWDVLFLIVTHATSASWSREEYDAAKIDDGSHGATRELKTWRAHYATCLALSQTCRFLHTATVPRLWKRVAILRKMSSTWLAELARTTSQIAPSPGAAPLRPFGAYTTELTLWRLLRPTDNAATITHLKAFQPVFPNLECLTLGPFLEERYPAVYPHLGIAWPRLRSLRRIPRMANGSAGKFADELARLPGLEALSCASGCVLNSRAIEALRLNTMLVNPLTGRMGTGLTCLLLGAGVIRDERGSPILCEATLFQVLSACPNLIKFHVAGAGSQMRWSSLDLSRFLDRLNPATEHLGFRPFGPVLGSLRHVLKRLPRLEFLSVRPCHVDFDLFTHAQASTSCLRHLELRDAATDLTGAGEQIASSIDEGFVWSSRAKILLGARRALEAASAGFALDRNLVLRLSSVVSIESTLLAEEARSAEVGKDGAPGAMQQEAATEVDDGDEGENGAWLQDQ